MPPKKIQKGNAPPPKEDTATTKAARAGALIGMDKNPLPIPEIAEQVLALLNPTDLVPCFDVCLLWRALSAKNRSPIVVRGDFNDKAAAAYLTSIRPLPIPANNDQPPLARPMAARFIFRNANLGSPAVQELLALNGDAMEELELCYGQQPKTKAKLMDFPTLGLLLRTQAPNLKTLIIRELPAEMVEVDKWPFHRQEKISGAADLLGLNTIVLKLTRIAVSTSCKFGERSRLLEHLFTASPHLEEVELIHTSHLAHRLGARIVLALTRAERLLGVKTLKFGTADPMVITLLSKHLEEGQLRHLSISKALFPRNLNFCGHLPVPPMDAKALGKLLTEQSGSIERLEVPFDRLTPKILAPPWPPMPNIQELLLMKTDEADGTERARNQRYGDPPDPEGPITIHGGAPFNYARDFPNLRLFGVKGLLENFKMDEIYPFGGPPASSVRILQEVPLGVGRELMIRIAQLFPNLTIIRTPILFGCEALLEAIWEGCPGLVELYVTVEGDGDHGDPYNEGEGEDRPSLDACFSGIPEVDCRRLRALPAEERRQELNTTDFEALRLCSPSLLNLQHLRRLCVDGPSTTLGGCGRRYEYRGDKLTDVFGISTLAATSKEFRFFQGRIGVTDLGEPTMDRLLQIEGGGGLTLVKKGMAGYDQKCVRLIREGFGYESLGAVPPTWYGH